MGGCCTPIPETTAQTQYDRFSITELDRSSENGAPAQSQTIVCHFLTQSVGVVSCCLFRDIRNAGLCRNSNRYDLEPELGKQPHEQHLFRSKPKLANQDLQLKLQLAMNGCCCPALESSKNARSECSIKFLQILIDNAPADSTMTSRKTSAPIVIDSRDGEMLDFWHPDLFKVSWPAVAVFI